MKVPHFLARVENRLDIVAGLVDGILNALTLAAAKVVEAGSSAVSLNLALRVSIAAGLTTIFVFFVAHYAELRLQLIRHERQLNMTEHGRLASSKLGQQIFQESLVKALLASLFSLVGALFPLLCCVIIPRPHWASPTIAILALASLGALLAKTFYGSTVVWALALAIFGVGMTLVGIELNLISS
jgi:predicted membrane protein (TIGR00267 family)